MYAPLEKYSLGMPRLQRYYGLNHLHYLTNSTYRRARLYDSERSWTFGSPMEMKVNLSSPPRKRGSTSRDGVDSRFRGNDVTLERAFQRSLGCDLG